jgi:hypothetical protein
VSTSVDTSNRRNRQPKTAQRREGNDISGHSLPLPRLSPPLTRGLWMLCRADGDSNYSELHVLDASPVVGRSGDDQGTLSTTKPPLNHAETPRCRVMGLDRARSPCALPMVRQS